MAQQLDPSIFGDSSKPLCRWPGCERRLHQKGLCSAHYKRQARGQPMDTPIRRYKPGALCAVVECGRPTRALGLCIRHYQRKQAGIEDWGKPIRETEKKLVRIGAVYVGEEVLALLDRKAALYKVRRVQVVRMALKLWADAQRRAA